MDTTSRPIEGSPFESHCKDIDIDYLSKCHDIVKAQKCHNIVEKPRESTLKGIRRMGTRLYLAGFAKEQRKSRVASVATCIALDLCCSEASIRRSECPGAVSKQLPYARLNDVVTLPPLRDVVNFVTYLVEGAEIIGFSLTTELRVIRSYQESDDPELYDLPPEFEKLAMWPGRFAVFFRGGHLLPS